MIKNKDVSNTRPTLGKIDQTGGIVPNTTTTYNQSNVTYNSTTQVYGGITGAKFGIKPQMEDVII